MNQLRAAIYAALPPDGYEMHDVERAQIARDILNAVIMALPGSKQVEYAMQTGDMHTDIRKSRFYRYGGYDFALLEVRKILEAAKEQK